MKLNTYLLSRVHKHTAAGKRKTYKVPVKAWKVVGTDIFMINNKNLLCIVDYYSNVPVLKKVESLLTKDLIQATKVVFAESSLPKNWSQKQEKFYFRAI